MFVGSHAAGVAIYTYADPAHALCLLSHERWLLLMVGDRGSEIILGAVSMLQVLLVAAVRVLYNSSTAALRSWYELFWAHVATLTTYRTTALRCSVVRERLNDTATTAGSEATGAMGSSNLWHLSSQSGDG